ncbi:MAG: nitrogenase component 1 [Pleomorphochaeta sp.]|nr:oxidoreductase [Sphaerochaetaceae bacterium]
MAKLCINLPPFSPDYSGVASSLFDLKCLSILHDASGCTGNYTSYDEPRWYGSQSPVMCSGLREIDAVLGDDEKLVRNTINAANELKVELISIIGSPVPMVIGTDSKGIAREIESICGIPTLGFDTTGTKYYDFGMSLALIELAKKFMRKQDRVDNPSVNLLGANVLDLTCENELRDIENIVKDCGVHIVATLPLGLSFETLKKAPSAWANIVLSKSGLKLAKYMKDKFNQPYFVGLPIGEGGKFNFISKLDQIIFNNDFEKIERFDESSNTLIISEQVKANAIRDCLNFKNCKVATLFGIEEEISEKGDKDLSCELEIINEINLAQYDLVVADPLILNLIESDDKKLIKIPHYAVSSKLFKNEKINLIGKNGDVFFKK